MPLALLAAGIVFLAAAVRGKQDELLELLRNDFTGPDNFLVWVAAIVAVGALGYIPGVRPVANALLALLLIVLLLSNRGFFAKFAAAVQATEAPAIVPQPGA